MIANYIRPRLADHGTARVRTRGANGSVTIESGKNAAVNDVSTNAGTPTASDTTA